MLVLHHLLTPPRLLSLEHHTSLLPKFRLHHVHPVQHLDTFSSQRGLASIGFLLRSDGLPRIRACQSCNLFELHCFFCGRFERGGGRLLRAFPCQWTRGFYDRPHLCLCINHWLRDLLQASGDLSSLGFFFELGDPRRNFLDSRQLLVQVCDVLRSGSLADLRELGEPLLHECSSARHCQVHSFGRLLAFGDCRPGLVHRDDLEPLEKSTFRLRRLLHQCFSGSSHLHTFDQQLFQPAKFLQLRQTRFEIVNSLLRHLAHALCLHELLFQLALCRGSLLVHESQGGLQAVEDGRRRRLRNLHFLLGWRVGDQMHKPFDFYINNCKFACHLVHDFVGLHIQLIVQTHPQIGCQPLMCFRELLLQVCILHSCHLLRLRNEYSRLEEFRADLLLCTRD
mmetsp:Transcript_43625/g.115252  ORF Transcript_43625/g.115252 Transcript_43625/m.115252 type:complete len:395 (-) Transcript_43625:1416-2600(-)